MRCVHDAVLADHRNQADFLDDPNQGLPFVPTGKDAREPCAERVSPVHMRRANDSLTMARGIDPFATSYG